LNNSNSNRQDNVYGAVITEEPLRELTQFTWCTENSIRCPPTMDNQLGPVVHLNW